MLSEKPNYLVFTEKNAIKLPIAWCLSAFFIGLATQELFATIFTCLATLFVVWLCYKVSSFFLSFQQHSGILKNATYDNVIKAIWFIALFSIAISFAQSLLFKDGADVYFNACFSISYFSFMLAAAKKWGMHYVEKRV